MGEISLLLSWVDSQKSLSQTVSLLNHDNPTDDFQLGVTAAYSVCDVYGSSFGIKWAIHKAA